VLRETTFLVGGVLVIGLGVSLGVGLGLAGAGLAYWSAWLSAGIAVGLGAFFLRVGVDARAYRRRWLQDVAEGKAPPPGGPPF
jgi:hypothetical protein